MSTDLASRFRRFGIVSCAVLVCASACSSGDSSSGNDPAPSVGVDGVADTTEPDDGDAPAGESIGARDVEIDTPVGTTAATFVSVGGESAPGVVLIAGSGPTDRDGNSAMAPGQIDTLRFLADELASAGIASVRFDKLGVGASEVPPDIAALTLTDFVDQADAVRSWFATQPGIDPAKITVAGHSEGGLIALELAANASVDSVALIAPLGGRYLDLIRTQVLAAGIGVSESDIDAAITELRSTGSIAEAPDDPQLAGLFPPTVHTFLFDADQRDPVALMSSLDSSTRVLLMCAEADIQVSCDSLDELRFAAPDASVDIRLAGVNHVLRQSGSNGDASTYTDTSLAHSPEASAALIEWAVGE